MATDKAAIVWRGETLAARAARVLSEVCDPVVEVGPGVSGLRHVREDPPGSGPLAALVAGARAVGTGVPVLLFACDLPFVDAPVLRLLAHWPDAGTVVPMFAGRLQYACARYGPEAIERAERALAAGDRSLRIVAEKCAVLSQEQWRAAGPENTFEDVDTPQDLLRLGLS